MKRKLLLYFFIFNSLFIFGQPVSSTKISGVVIDNITRQTLPFVNVVYNKQKEGFTTSIDGYFELELTPKIEFLQFSYLGYETQFFSLAQIKNKNNLTVRLKSKTFDIEEITVFAQENPAHRIIRQAVENKELNAPNHLSSYSLTAYNKAVVTMDLDKSLQMANEKKMNIDSIKNDTSYIKAKKIIDSLYFFMMESLSERKFEKPSKISERIVASRVAGFKDASLFMLATQLQSFSFYDEMLTIAESRYINPISKGSMKRYFFNIEDTTFTARGDTVFIISFKPKKGKNFEALEGVLSINSYKYAVQNVVAKPIAQEGLVATEITQNYKLIDNQYWFPTEMITKMVFQNVVAQAGTLQLETYWYSRGYNYNIRINPPFGKKDFSVAELEINPDATRKDSLFWNQNRLQTLDKKEKNTYQIIDSLGKAAHLDLRLKTIQTLSKGFIPFWIFDLEIDKFITFNEFEDFRFRMGARTNTKVSRFFSIGGYGAYALGDKQWKYGSNLQLNIWQKRDLKINFQHQNDVMEAANYSFLEKYNFSTSEMYRKYLVSDMIYFKNYSVGLNAMVTKHLQMNFNTAYSDYWLPKENFYRFNSLNISHFHFFETQLQLRYAPKEQKAFIGNEFVPLQNIANPVFFVNLTKGFEWENASFDYYHAETKIKWSFLTKSFGKSSLQLTAGKVWGEVPYFKLYNGNEAYSNFSIETINSFATMRMNEFLSSQFFAAYFRQDLGSLLLKTKKFKPTIELITHFAIGNIDKPQLNSQIAFKTLEKGYWESGIMVNNIFKQINIIGYGFGIYYRYGAYALPTTKENLAYRFSILFNL